MKFDPSQLVAIVDMREQNPWDLSPLKTQRATLYSGDYSIRGLEHVISLEKKTLGELAAICGRERARFERELARLRGFPTAAVIIEATWAEIESGAWMTAKSKITPNHVLGNLTSRISQGHTIICGQWPNESGSRSCNMPFDSGRIRPDMSERIQCFEQTPGGASAAIRPTIGRSEYGSE